MKKSEFLNELTELLQKDDVCRESDILNEYEEWDSLAILSISAFFNNNFKISISLDDVKNLNTVSDLIKLAGDNING